MFSSSQRTLRCRMAVFLLLGLVLSVNLLVNSVAITSAQGEMEVCIFTPELQEGQGFSVSGLGFSVSGLGFSVSGLGFSVSGLGFSVSGLGVTPEEVALEVVSNPVTPQWLIDHFQAEIEGGTGFNETPVAVVIVDDFGGDPANDALPSPDDPHGKKVNDVAESLLEALGTVIDSPNIIIVPLDVSDDDTNYRLDVLRQRVETQVRDLIEQGYKHIVLNFSFGVLPCDSEVTLDDGTKVPFNFDDATSTIEKVNDPQPVINYLECVSYSGDGVYIAHFGYENPNGAPVTVPQGADNFLSGGGLSPEMLAVQTPTHFGRPNVVEGKPGRSDFYPNSAFQVLFKPRHYHDKLEWTLHGRTVKANAFDKRQKCSPQPSVYPNFHPKHSVQLPVIENVLHCVVDNEDGTLTAHLGYNNPFDFPKLVPHGSRNFLKGGGLSDHTRKLLTPVYFGTPGIDPDHPGRSAPFPNSAFQIRFSADKPLEWHLFGNVVVASSESETCVQPEGFGFAQYLAENNNLESGQVAQTFAKLVQQVEDDPSQPLAELQTLLQELLRLSADESNPVMVIPVASSGNYRYLFPRTDPTNTHEPLPPAPPLSPASLPETIAVSALLGNVTQPVTNPVSEANRDALWRFSHDGNVAVPGGAIELSPGNFVVGTSYAAPYTSMLAALWLTYADACTYTAVNRPPLNLEVAGDFSNALFTDESRAYPLTCERPVDEGPTLVEIDIEPFSRRNIINFNSASDVKVVVFGSRDFDAGLIDPNTVLFAGAAPVAPHHYWPKFELKHVNHDRFRDMVFHFKIQDLVLEPDAAEATLTGETFAGELFEGTDSVTIVPLAPPRLLWPEDGQVFRTNFPLLMWNRVASASCYRVEINDTPFTSDVQEEVLQRATIVKYGHYRTTYLADGQYYWRVQVGGACDIAPGPWSETRTFTIDTRRKH